MKVVEIFSSIDGEGKRTGQPATFIRLAGCNLRCGYCDTKYSFDCSKAREMSINAIIEECKAMHYKNITLTGGEPLIHQDVKALIKSLCEFGFKVNVETNGSVNLLEFVQLRDWNNYDLFFTVDYKCISSGMRDYMVPTAFGYLDINKDIVKCVVSNEQDMQDALKYLDSFNKPFNIWFSPVFGAIKPKDIVEYVLSTGREDITVQVQLHKIIWEPDKRGV